MKEKKGGKGKEKDVAGEGGIKAFFFKWLKLYLKLSIGGAIGCTGSCRTQRLRILLAKEVLEKQKDSRCLWRSLQKHDQPSIEGCFRQVMSIELFLWGERIKSRPAVKKADRNVVRHSEQTAVQTFAWSHAVVKSSKQLTSNFQLLLSNFEKTQWMARPTPRSFPWQKVDRTATAHDTFPISHTARKLGPVAR